jgi:hypothetical protein
MLDQILAMVKAHGETAIVQNPAIPNEHNDAAIGMAAQSIFSGIQGAVTSGALPQLMGLLGNSDSLMNSPVVKGILANFGEQLKTKLSFSPDQAATVAASALPNILSGVLAQFGGANGNSSDLMGLAQKLMAGQTGSVGSSLTSSLDVNKDGKVDIKDAISHLGGDDESAMGVAGKLLSGLIK